MPKHVEVKPEDLHVSAGTVDAHADIVRARHVEADARMEAAQAGIPAGAVAALSSAVTKWQGDTTAIFGRMVDHAHGMRTGAVAYAQTDESSRTDLKHAEQQIGEVDLGL
ncbi:MAG: hypothetical protein QOD36_2706 [Mycobacterium sp.]|jgi:hypothetical protein|nr:hypothetical protein [Mycobacterium sp.]